MGHMRQNSGIGSDNTSAGFSICVFLIGEMGVISFSQGHLKKINVEFQESEGMYPELMDVKE